MKAKQCVSVDLLKVFTVCVSVEKVPVARLSKPLKRSLLFVNEQFGGKRNTANGTLWTDTKLFTQYNDISHNALIIVCLCVQAFLN